jgi:hypothetical protein
MAKKRKPGGGRKPKGDFSRLTSPLTIRMPAEMRKQLEAAANKSGKNVTQELLRRLQNSFNRDREKSRDPALRALCFLIAEIAEGVVLPEPIRFPNAYPLWRSNPFLFRAFKLAVGKLLDALEPPGEIQAPVTLEPAEGVKIPLGPLDQPEFLLNKYVSPEALSNYVIADIWTALHGTTPAQTRYEEMRRAIKQSNRDRRIDRFAYDTYEMQDARRDLQIRGERP